jgi:hypothetical protein
LAAPAYTRRFLAASGPAKAVYESAVVPPGVVWVVRDIVVSAWDFTSEGDFGLYVKPETWVLALGPFGGAPGSAHHELRQVLEPGEFLQYGASTSSTVLVTGYQLQG